MRQDISMHASIWLRGINPQGQCSNQSFQLSHQVRTIRSLQSQSYLQIAILVNKTYQE